jgi:hypothetical protein
VTNATPDPEVPDTSDSNTSAQPTASDAAPLSNRDRKLLERLSTAFGEPVIAAHRFWTEGSYPWYLIGIAVGVGVLQGALGALIGLAVGYAIARLVTSRRAPGLGATTLVALTVTKVVFIRGTRATGKRVGEWPVTQVRASWHRKRLTNAFAFDVPDGRHLRLESWGLGARRGADNLVTHLRANGMLTEE